MVSTGTAARIALVGLDGPWWITSQMRANGPDAVGADDKAPDFDARQSIVKEKCTRFSAINDAQGIGSASDRKMDPIFGPMLQFVRTQPNGYGYGCACLTAETDRQASRITKVPGGGLRPLAQCRADRSLPKPEM